MVQESDLIQEKRYSELKAKDKPDLIEKFGKNKLILIIFVGAAILYYYNTGGANQNFVFLLALILVVVVLLSFKTEESGKLSEEQCRAIGWNWIKNAQQTIHGYPQGDVEMPGVGKEHESQGEPKYWEFYFTVRTVDGMKKKYSIAIYSYGNFKGHIKHIRPRTIGWTGEEAPDVFRHYIPVSKGYISPEAEQFRKMKW